MSKIEKIKDDLYVRKSFGEWIIVRPIKKDLEKPYAKDNINWKNLLVGSWGSFIKMLILFGIIAFLIWSYREDMKTCTDALNSPCVQQCHENYGLKLLENYTGVMNYERENIEGLSGE